MRAARSSLTPGARAARRSDFAPILIEGREPAVVSAVSEAEARALVELARGRSVLEVGSAWGYSTIIMATVARHLVSVDPHADLQSEATFRANLAAHGVAQKVEVWVEPSRSALPTLYATGRRFGLIFIDGDHSSGAVSFDALWARHLAEPQAVIAFHDYHAEQGEGVRAGLAAWPVPDELVERLAVYRGRAQV